MAEALFRRYTAGFPSKYTMLAGLQAQISLSEVNGDAAVQRYLHRVLKEGVMEQNGQDQQKRGDLSERSEQSKQEEEAQEEVLDAEIVEEEEEEQSDEVQEELREAQHKAEEYLDLLRRTQADFVNYRRRMSQEQTETRTTAQIALLNQLLPVLDDFERALEAIPEDLAQHPWVQGLLLVARRLATLLDQLGVRQVGVAGELFDPRLHEAITLEERADLPEGTIVQVVRSGYALGERIIRPAQVIVAGAPSTVSDISE